MVHSHITNTQRPGRVLPSLVLPDSAALSRHSSFSSPSSRRLSSVRVNSAEEDKESESGHKDTRPRREPSEKELRLMDYQRKAPKLSCAVEAKSLVKYGNGYGVISTIAQDGYPGGSVVMYAPDEQGLPVFSFSTMSSHTQDLLQSSKASLTVKTNEFKGAADARVNLVGDIEKITDESELKQMREVFKAKHPGAFWVEFGDFAIFRMTKLKSIRFVGGFARAANVGADEYLSCSEDPVMAFSDKIAGHMNDDHQDATKIIMKHAMDIDCETAEIASVDSLGMTVFVTVKQLDDTVSDPFKLRVGFPEEAPDRVAVRNMLKRMTNEAAAAMQGA